MTESTLIAFDKSRQLILTDCELQYCKLVKAVLYKERWQWEMSIKTTDADQAQNWADNHLNVRPNNTMKPTEWVVSLNRKTHTKDGTAQEPVRVVDLQKRPLSDEAKRKIGNDSIGNVILWQGKFDNSFGTGVTTSLTAVQIKKLIEYNGGMAELDFESFGEEGDAEIAMGADGAPADLF